MLAVEQHDGTEGPGKQLTERCEDTGEGGIIQGQRFVFRVHNAKQNKADGKHPRGVAEYKQRAFKPASFVHRGAKIQQGNDHHKNAEQKQKH